MTDLHATATRLASRIESRTGFYTPEHYSAAWRLVHSVDWLAFRKPGEAHSPKGITTMNTIKLPLIACLLCLTTVASAEEKKPRKPSVHHIDACQPVSLKGAMGATYDDVQDGPPRRDTAMLCTSSKGAVRVLKDWRILAYGDGDMFVVGR